MGISRSLRTFLGQPPPLVQLELLVVARALDRRVTPGAREGDLHGLVEQLKALDLLDGLVRRLGPVEDYEGLALGL